MRVGVCECAHGLGEKKGEKAIESWGGDWKERIRKPVLSTRGFNSRVYSLKIYQVPTMPSQVPQYGREETLHIHK